MNCSKNISRGCCFSRNEQGEAVAVNVEGCHKMETYDWLEDTPNLLVNKTIYEVQFKNTRKSYFEKNSDLELIKGDIVVVESSPGLDVGIVSMTGDLVAKQMAKYRFSPQDLEFKKIIRKAKPYDIEKWQEAISLEHNTMIRSRQIASDLGLRMKIGDVEYQGDRLKAIFYYIADDRVDFRELIKILAEQFRVRIEMKQIGARQEAGRIGGISACGRELCCSTWQNSFQSVTIGSARHQEISLNPQKLAGQCGKLKCCLNYEVDNYIDARKDFPRINAPLEALDGSYHLIKTDIFKKVMWFSPDPMSTSIMIPVGLDRVRKIMALNRKGSKVDKIEDETLIKQVVEEPQYMNVVGEESITRFDKSGNNSRRRNNNRNRNGNENGEESTNNGANNNGSNGDNNRSNGERQSANGQQRQRTERRQNDNQSENRSARTDGQPDKRNSNRGENNRNRSENQPDNRNNKGESRTERSSLGEKQTTENRNDSNRSDGTNRNETRSENGNRSENRSSENGNRNQDRYENRNRNRNDQRQPRVEKSAVENRTSVDNSNGGGQNNNNGTDQTQNNNTNGVERPNNRSNNRNRFRNKNNKPQE